MYDFHDKLELRGKNYNMFLEEDIERMSKGDASEITENISKSPLASHMASAITRFAEDMNIGVSEERMKLLTRILRSDKACGVVDNAFLCFDDAKVII